MKKILILNWRDPMHSNAGGAEQATLKHALAWQNAGYSVTWFSSHTQGLLQEEEYMEIKIIRKGFYVFGVQLCAFLHLQKNKYDLVVDQIHGLPFFTPLYLNKVPKLAYIHELTKEVAWHNPYIFPINKFVGILACVAEPVIFKLFYKNMQFMTVSESTEKELKNMGVKNIKVIHNGVTMPKNYKLYPKNKNKTLIYLGAIARDKGIMDAIYIFNKLLKKHKDWNFWVVGKGEEKILKEISLIDNKKIKFFGFVEDSKKFELLSRAHLLINPSIREGWGLVNIEANAMGTPVIGYNVAGVKDSVKNDKTGILVDNKGDMITAIEDLFEDVEKYDKLSKSAKLSSLQYDWNKTTKESTELINILCKKLQ